VFVELIESLRCPRAHEPSALIASTTRVIDRHIVDGVLGCPICRSEFPITEGIARFDDDVVSPPPTPASDDAAMRLAAFLELTDARGFVVLAGRWAAHVERVRGLTQVAIVLLNPPADVSSDSGAGTIVARDTFPFAVASARAAALDVSMSAPLIASTVAAVRDGGRLVGPIGLATPAGVTEIARDDRDWVGQKTAAQGAPRLVTLSRSKS
jgi:uncharacterized protein YbaR (Trm112 family)